MSHPAPGWETDPTGKHDHRYWDGTQWTENVADAGVAGIDPYEAPVPPVATTPLFGTEEPSPIEPSPIEAGYAPEPVTGGESLATEDVTVAESPLAPAEDETLVDQRALAEPTDAYPTAGAPASWPYADITDDAPAAPPPYVPSDTGSSSRFGGLGERVSGLGNLGDGAKRGLLVGGGILVAVILAVVAMNVLGGDDDSPTTPIGSSDTSDTTDTTGPAKDGEYGSDPALDELYEGCQDGDFAACDQLYLASESGSGYQTFGDTCGERNEPSGFCVKLYGEGGDGEDGEGTDGELPEDFEETTAEQYASSLGLTQEQAECLAGKFREAVEEGTLDEGDVMTGVVEYLADCDITLEDLSD